MTFDFGSLFLVYWRIHIWWVLYWKLEVRDQRKLKNTIRVSQCIWYVIDTSFAQYPSDLRVSWRDHVYLVPLMHHVFMKGYVYIYIYKYIVYDRWYWYMRYVCMDDYFFKSHISQLLIPSKGMGLPMSDRPPGWLGLMWACWLHWLETQKWWITVEYHVNILFLIRLI